MPKVGLEVAQIVGTVHPFMESDTAKNIVVRLFPSLDSNRLLDVAKMLRVTARQLYTDTTLPEYMKVYVEERRKN